MIPETKPSELKLTQAFLIGYVVWFVPCVVHWLWGGLTARMFGYAAVTLLALHALTLGVIATVFRTARARGLSLLAASIISLAATVPAIAISYLADFAMTQWDPTLVRQALPEKPTVAYTLASAFADSFTICAFQGAIVFLPMFARAHEERGSQLALVSREAELLRFRAHLEPHFVLNSLNAVAGLVEEDPVQARELLAALGDLFREASAFHTVHRVGDEIEWLKRYVMIHELRHPDILRASWDVSPESEEMSCPALILQPLVENAVKHGALRGGGHLVVRAHVAGETLTLVVEDDGPELGAPRDGGRGLAIIRRRLELESLKSDAFYLGREGDRTIARVRLPARKGAIHA
ncbi:two-component system sensor kinase [Labilithrix luteola]|uniref:Two-component system sensor kinase n=1 Tax=Labilithrix luteola TaxID=1391654 RepID=A0A0K1Q3Z5_9BACT|nr:histidine kinase [Labilithrix luteola]AKV00362.1 two-component system sensor kinase [Labilithrix luteola]